MESKQNYFNHSMNEIVFEKKNQEYGAFQLRLLYKKNLRRAITITLSIFILSTVGPFLIDYLHVFENDEPLVLETRSYVLTAPPSIKPLQPIKPPPAKIEEVKRPSEKFIELEATKKELVKEVAPPTIKDLSKKEINNIKKDSVDKNNTQTNTNNNGSGNEGEGKIWSRVEQPPQFIGGEDAYYQYLSDNVDYPIEAEKKKIEGTAWISFVVTQDGSITQVNVDKTSGNKLLDEEAMRVISIMPKYKPGVQNGHTVKTICVLPITFFLPK